MSDWEYTFRKLDTIEEGKLYPLKIGWDEFIMLLSDGTLFVYQGLCPHAHAPLCEGSLQNKKIVCPIHKWTFDAQTGKDCGGMIDLKSFPVEVKEDGKIYIQLIE